jgi:hypothetical protein
MTRLEELLDEWDRDSLIDRTELGDAAIQGARLHSKYLRYLAIERLKLAKLIEAGKELRLAKHEFYTQGPTKETQEQGWQPPAIGRPLNKDVPLYMDADKQVIEHNLKVAYQSEIVKAIDLIFVAIKARGFDIGRKLDEMKLRMGA